jgi:hypothetical protein
MVLVPLPEIEVGENEIVPAPVEPLHVNRGVDEAPSLQVRATEPEKPPKFVRLSKLVSVKVLLSFIDAELSDSFSVKSWTLNELLVAEAKVPLVAVNV